MKKRLLVSALGISLIGTSLFGGSTSSVLAAERSGSGLTSVDESVVPEQELTIEEINEGNEYIREQLNSYGVSQETTESLIAKLDRGEIWDSLNPEKKGTEKTIKIDNYTEKKIFPDGSIIINEIDTADATIENIPPRYTSPTIGGNGGSSDPGLISPFATVGGGTVTSGSGYTNVKGATVKSVAILVNAYYKVNYGIAYSGNDSITSVYGYNITVVRGSYSLESFGVKRGTENVNGKAYASLRFAGTIDGVGTTSYYLNVYVGDNKASATSNIG